jgi:hypothetical protein
VVTVSSVSGDDEGGRSFARRAGSPRAEPVEHSLERAPAASSFFLRPRALPELPPRTELSLVSHRPIPDSSELPNLFGDPSVYSLAHRQLREMEAREKRVAQSVARELEKFKAKEAYLAAERQKLDDARARHITLPRPQPAPPSEGCSFASWPCCAVPAGERVIRPPPPQLRRSKLPFFVPTTPERLPPSRKSTRS